MPRCTNWFAKNIKGSKVKSVLITEKKLYLKGGMFAFLRNKRDYKVNSCMQIFPFVFIEASEISNRAGVRENTYTRFLEHVGERYYDF